MNVIITEEEHLLRSKREGDILAATLELSFTLSYGKRNAHLEGKVGAKVQGHECTEGLWSVVGNRARKIGWAKLEAYIFLFKEIWRIVSNLNKYINDDFFSKQRSHVTLIRKRSNIPWLSIFMSLCYFSAFFTISLPTFMSCRFTFGRF